MDLVYLPYVFTDNNQSHYLSYFPTAIFNTARRAVLTF